MRGMLLLRGAILGLAVTGVTLFAQTPTAPTVPTTPTAPAGKATTAPAAPAVSPTQVAVDVNGEPIYELAVLRALERVPPTRRAEERPRLVNYLIDNLLIDQSLRAAGYKAEPAEVEKKVTEMKAELKKVGKDFDKMLGDLKINESELRHHIGADMRWFKYASAQATDKALEQLFATNKDMFDESAVRARHILFSTAGKSEKDAAALVTTARATKAMIENEIAAGVAKIPVVSDKAAMEKAKTAMVVETFAKYAKEKSDCPTKNHGGDINWFQKAGFIVAPFSNAAFAMQVGQISDVVATPFGYHLILVTDKKPGKDVKFADVKEIAKEVYFDRLHDGLAATLRKTAKINYTPASK